MPREIENNPYLKFGWTNKEYYGISRFQAIAFEENGFQSCEFHRMSLGYRSDLFPCLIMPLDDGGLGQAYRCPWKLGARVKYNENSQNHSFCLRRNRVSELSRADLTVFRFKYHFENG